jgi:hypothetical protein
VALLLVVAVLATSAVLGMAMLSGGALQVQAAKNEAQVVGARALAESGVSLAAYYLQYPGKAPVRNGEGYWPGETGMSLGASVPGTVDVHVSRPSRNVYNVSSTGKAAGPSGELLSRTIVCQLQINPGFATRYAANFSADTVLPLSTTVWGDVQAAGKITNNGRIYGMAYWGTSATLGATGTWAGAAPLTSDTSVAVPTSTQLRDYRTYTYQGRTYQAGIISANTLGSGTTLGPTGDNPAGVYYRQGELSVGHYLTVNGTLIVDGQLSVTGGYGRITPADGFPGLIVKSNLQLKGSGSVRDLTVSGVTWLGGSITSTGYVATGWFRFNGSLLFGDNGGVAGTFGGSVYVNYDATAPQAPGLDGTLPPQGVKMLSWQE